MGVMTAIAVGGAVIGAAGGISKMISGGKAKREAKRELRKYKRQNFKNVNQGRRISTKAAELAMEESARTAASSLELLSSGGVRGSVGGTQNIQEASNRLSQQTGAYLDKQQVQLDKEIAMDNARIRQLQEQRDNQNIATLQAQLNAGAQTQASGLGDVAQSGFAIASMAGNGAFSADGAKTSGSGDVGSGDVGSGGNPSVTQSNQQTLASLGNIGGAFGAKMGVMNQPAPQEPDWNIDPLTGLPYSD